MPKVKAEKKSRQHQEVKNQGMLWKEVSVSITRLLGFKMSLFFIGLKPSLVVIINYYFLSAHPF